MAPEILYGIGAVVLALFLIWGVRQTKTRNRANDPITEQATRESYKHPESYGRREKELKKEVRPS